MKKVIDIHSHILPGVDDGAANYEMSMQMLRCAANDGISAIILTPHNKPGHRHIPVSEMDVRVEKLRGMMAEEAIKIELYMGSEVYYRSGMLEKHGKDAVITMAKSRYLLVEFHPLEEYGYIRGGIYSLLTEGYYPILAHAERYQNVCAEKSGISDLIEMGCYIQVNADSVTGKSGWKARQFVKSILKKGQVHFVATDAHDLKKRAPRLSDCADFIEKKYGGDYSRKLFFDNPMDVIGDNVIAL